MHFQCNTQVQISCMNPCKLLRSLYALISCQSNGDCLFFFLKKGVLGIWKLKKKKCASTLAEKILSAKQRGGKLEKTHNSKWLALNIQARAKSHEPCTTVSNSSFSEATVREFHGWWVPIQLRLLRHHAWMEVTFSKNASVVSVAKSQRAKGCQTAPGHNSA